MYSFGYPRPEGGGGPECAICYGDVAPPDVRRAAGCGHAFHLDPCLRRYFETSISEGKVRPAPPFCSRAQLSALRARSPLLARRG